MSSVSENIKNRLRMVKYMGIAESSNGRTSDSGSEYLGSSPGSAAKMFVSILYGSYHRRLFV